MVGGRTLLVGAFSAHGGMGGDLAKELDRGFKSKYARAKVRAEGGLEVLREKKNLLESIGATIARYNFRIVSANIVNPGGQRCMPTAVIEPGDRQ